MLPHNHILLLKSRHPFHAELCLNEKRLTATDSIKANDGSHFAFLLPASRSTAAKLKLNLCTNLPESGMHHETSDILQLSSGNEISITTELNREAVRNSRHYALLTNNRGAISQVRLEWGHIESQYDCLLGANLHDSVPVDRQIVFTRCRAWLVHRDYSQAITTDCLQSVSVNSDNSVKWNFAVPAGMGKTINLRIRLRLIQERNCIRLSFERFACNTPDRELNPTDPVTLILRPDIEDRNFHETTKAHTGPETAWNKALKPLPDGFRFSTSPHHTLELNMPNSRFVPEAEWTYGVPHPFEAQRGLNDSGDLFSPGYLETKLLCDRTTIITAKVTTDNSMPLSEREITTHHSENIAPSSSPIPLLNAMRLGMQAFIVKRDDTRTVIAGYPWFLDWGRDTLICLRGIIAAEMYSEARDILIQFAHFEAQGTLPNMIRGNDDSNRDTTDAPLWFFTACSDFMQANPESDFLDTDCQGRTIRQILTSIASHYIDGTPNGIVMDSETALIFSPSHYTWMDTNHPAGTPREGYPIEIQALWFAALKFMATIDDTPRWKELALQVQQSIEKLYALPDRNYLADCLLASPGTPAKDAVQDNALRPNQLFAVTLGAVTDRQKALDILSASECLLIPGAIRSLADQPVSPPLPVYRDGQLLNDPERPFRGYYGGDEDTRRKPAYHNGTAWSWPFPSYCEALYIIGGESLRETALSIISSSSLIANSGCIGHIPEILDANSPHHQRGCQAQAWGDTELYRVLKLLQ
jgi:predicted glycogen debranching enzyme